MSELSRLRWLCRRGMKELDVVLSGYLEQNYATASPEDQASFRRLLDMPDPDVYGMLLGRGKIDDPGLERLIEFLRGMSARN
ncbi:MAG: succinate dehydrogenase assembly factor 2 family protein [Gammaproteobacteria bacterium]|nr:MAG: succinate dehydrogenase assembly factor 2 family protein [Gammaproteobacteria bacterium]